MNENVVRAVLRGDESVAFLIVEPLNCAFHAWCFFLFAFAAEYRISWRGFPKLESRTAPEGEFGLSVDSKSADSTKFRTSCDKKILTNPLGRGKLDRGQIRLGFNDVFEFQRQLGDFGLDVVPNGAE